MNAAVIEQHAEQQYDVHQIVLYNDTLILRRCCYLEFKFQFTKLLLFIPFI